jgi:hypothetical protein
MTMARQSVLIAQTVAATLKVLGALIDWKRVPIKISEARHRGKLPSEDRNVLCSTPQPERFGKLLRKQFETHEFVFGAFIRRTV